MSVFAKALSSKGESWRRDFWTRFEEQGLPHRRLEGWAWSDIEEALNNAPPLPPRRPSAKDEKNYQNIKALAEMEGRHLVLSNGFLMTEAKNFPKEKGLEILSFAEALSRPPSWLKKILEDEKKDKKEESALTLLNKALCEDGAVIRVRAGVKISEPLHLLFSSCARAACPALVVFLEEGAQLSLIETHQRQKRAGFMNLLRRVRLEKSAKLHHLILQEDQEKMIHNATSSAHLAAASCLKTGIITEGAALTRMSWESDLEDESAEAHLSAIFLLGDKRHSDITAHARHKKPCATSSLSARALLGGSAQGVFQAGTTIAHGAYGSDAQQNARALLLSPHAYMHVKPELAIYADDVQCAHGSAIGVIDESALFYLRQRGIPDKEARKMLAQAFLKNGLDALRGTQLHDRALAESLSSLDRLWEGQES